MTNNTSNRKSGSSVYLSNDAWTLLEKNVEETRNRGEKTNVSALIDAAVRSYFGEKNPRELITRHLSIIKNTCADTEELKQITTSVKIIKENLDKI